MWRETEHFKGHISNMVGHMVKHHQKYCFYYRIFIMSGEHGSLITWLNNSLICAAISCNIYLPEFILFNPRFRLLTTLTHMKGSECV